MLTTFLEGPSRTELSSLTSLLFRFDFSFDAVDVAEVDDEGEGGDGEDVALRLGRGMLKLLNVSPIHSFVNVGKVDSPSKTPLKTEMESDDLVLGMMTLVSKLKPVGILNSRSLPFPPIFNCKVVLQP